MQYWRAKEAEARMQLLLYEAQLPAQQVKCIHDFTDSRLFSIQFCTRCGKGEST